MVNTKILCEREQVEPGVCLSFDLVEKGVERQVFMVVTTHGYYVYENSCPHTGVTLDWIPDQFLNIDKTLIQCSTHHALFRIEDGYCVSGPCSGSSLRRLSTYEQDGKIWVEHEGEEGPIAP